MSILNTPWLRRGWCGPTLCMLGMSFRERCGAFWDVLIWSLGLLRGKGWVLGSKQIMWRIFMSLGCLLKIWDFLIYHCLIEGSSGITPIRWPRVGWTMFFIFYGSEELWAPRSLWTLDKNVYYQCSFLLLLPFAAYVIVLWTKRWTNFGYFHAYVK